jgi:hypothetical protein
MKKFDAEGKMIGEVVMKKFDAEGKAISEVVVKKLGMRVTDEEWMDFEFSDSGIAKRSDDLRINEIAVDELKQWLSEGGTMKGWFDKWSDRENP